MSKDRISVALTQEQTDAIWAKLAALRESLPFLSDLTQEERESLPKFGDKSFAFVEKALEVGRQNPNILPRKLDVEEMAQDVAMTRFLRNLRLQLKQLLDAVDNTGMLTGADAYSAALIVYQHAKDEPGLESAVDELGKRFARKSGGKTAQPPTP